MYAVDLTVMGMIQSALEHLRNDKEELSLIMSDYANQWTLSQAVGSPAHYIDQMIKFIMDKSQPIARIFQGYDLSPHSNIAVYVYASGVEDSKYFGDFGSFDSICRTPTIYARAGAHHIEESDGRSVLYFTRTCGIQEKVWRLQACVNSKLPVCSFEVVSVTDDGEDFVAIELDCIVPEVNGAQPLDGWEFRSAASGWQVQYGNSGDTVTARVFLRTTGDAELHRLVATVIRWALKRSRQYFEFENFQIASMSQSEPSPDFSGEQCAGFTTTFTVSGKAHDMWILRKTKIPERVQVVIEAIKSDASI